MHVVTVTVNCLVRTSKIQVSPSLNKPTFQSRRTTLVTLSPLFICQSCISQFILKGLSGLFHGLVVNGAFIFEVIKVGNIFEFIIFIVFPPDDLVD